MTCILSAGRDAELRHQLAAWAADRIPHVSSFPPECETLAVMEGSDPWNLDNRVLAVVVFHEWVYGTIQISCAAASPKWASPRVLRSLLEYPFGQLGCRKVHVIIPHTNDRAIKFNAGIGMRKEATIRHYFADGLHGVVLGMTRREFDKRWASLPAMAHA